ncbi:MAG TPA: CDP-diacylglycerol--serine O-phosphatidyltransferase [Candidatus Deferrimicrobium sp.]|nr:CDP-diacylglycerol--serine O-phosphatidyltransferase [Candidatus Deferrimicrobium sp.]
MYLTYGRREILHKTRKFKFNKQRKVNIARLTKISFLPSIFTLSSLFLGYLALIQILKGRFESAVFLITGSVILDGFDGTVARLTKTESNFGVQLDSLVDAVVFGTVTSVMIYRWGFQGEFSQLGKVIGFIFLSAGIIRLARFNVLKEAETYVSNVFIGLPIPLGALSVASVILLREKLVEKHDIILFSIYVALVAFLMISNIKYRTMKRLNSRNNLVVLFSLAIVIALLINFPTYTIPAISLIYLISPLFYFFFDKFKKKGTPETPASIANDGDDIDRAAGGEDVEDAEAMDDDDTDETEEA